MPLTRVTLENLKAVFTYQPWDEDQTKRGLMVQASLEESARVILEVIPECPSRTRAINNLIDARMLANQAISLEHLT